MPYRTSTRGHNSPSPQGNDDPVRAALPLTGAARPNRPVVAPRALVGMHGSACRVAPQGALGMDGAAAHPSQRRDINGGRG